MSTLELVFNIIRVVFIFLDILLAGVLIFSLKKAWPYRPRVNPKKLGGKPTYTIKRADAEAQWGTILKKFAQGMDGQRIAIISADNFIDKILKDAGLGGDFMADRLDQMATDGLLTLNRLWRAHRVRNDLVHTPGFVLTEELAEKTMEDYTAFLKEIGILA